jgi:hypothetical protein
MAIHDLSGFINAALKLAAISCKYQGRAFVY